MKEKKFFVFRWSMCLVMAFMIMCFTSVQANADGFSEGVTLPEGIYTFRSAMDNNMVIDVYGGYSGNGSNIQLYQSNNGVNQQFYITPVGGNWYTIVSLIDQQMSLDVHGGKSNPGSNVCLWGYHNQLWRFIPCGDGNFLIESHLGLYLDIEKADCRNEANIIAYSKNGNANQRWRLDAIDFRSQYGEAAYIPDGEYIIRSAMNSDMAVDAHYGNTDNGTNIQLYTYNDGTNQRFLFQHVEANLYKILSIDDHRMCLDVYGGQSVPGSNVCLWTYHGQLWSVLPCDDGTYLIQSDLGLYLDVEKADCRNEANIIAYSRNLNTNQRWWLDAVQYVQ